MSISTDTIATKYLNPVTGTPISVAFPAFAVGDVKVLYGVVGLLAVQDTDYTVELNTVDFSDFEITPLASLRTKINALLAADDDEVDQIVVRREMTFLTTASPTLARLRQFIADEFDRTSLRFIQLNEALDRSLKVAETDTSGNSNILPVLAASRGIKRNPANDGWILTTGDPDEQTEDAAASAVAALASQVAAAASAAAALVSENAADASATSAADSEANATLAANLALRTILPTDSFDGTGAQTVFTLSRSVIDSTSVFVYVEGIKQHHDTYTASDTTLTFTTAPPAGTGNVEVVFMGATGAVLALDEIPDNAISLDMVDFSTVHRFMAKLTTNPVNITGNTNLYTVVCDTELRDVGGAYNHATGVFTAITPGFYSFSGGLRVQNMTAAADAIRVTLLTTDFTYMLYAYNNLPNLLTSAWGEDWTHSFSVSDVWLDAGDTARVQIQGFGEASNSWDLIGTTNETWFSGHLEA